jgi:Family of unknown function (DUF5681)
MAKKKDKSTQTDVSLTAVKETEKPAGRGKHPNSLKNLQRFQAGESGNPGGRSKKPITEAYERLAEMKFPGDSKGRTYAELAAEGNFKSAIKGKTEAIKEITDRLEGKVVQQTELTGAGGDPVSHTIALDDEILELIKQLAGK